MREDKAIAVVEQKWGSLEEFGWDLLRECPEVLDGDYDPLHLSQKLGVDLDTLTSVLRGSAYMGLMTRLAVAHEWTVGDELKHVKSIKADAINKSKNTDTRIKARSHLAVLAGRPLQAASGGNQGMVLQINFGQPSPPPLAGDEKTIDVEVHRPARAGDLPPPGARRRRAEEPADGRTVDGVAMGGELDFRSDESPYTPTGPIESKEPEEIN